MTSFVVDSSVVFRWYRQTGDEDYVPQAVSILERYLHGEIETHVPDLLFHELGNILRLKETLVSKDAFTILRETFALSLLTHLIDLALSEEAFRFARGRDLTFCDASFVALARLLDASFITADKKLFLKLKTMPTAIFLGSLS